MEDCVPFSKEEGLEHSQKCYLDGGVNIGVWCGQREGGESACYPLSWRNWAASGPIRLGDRLDPPISHRGTRDQEMGVYSSGWRESHIPPEGPLGSAVKVSGGWGGWPPTPPGSSLKGV